MTDHGEVTDLLHAYAGGDRDAFDRLVPMVYDELRRIARNHLRRTNRGVTLDTTGLVHEAYMKLAGQKGMRVEDRGHFLAIAACAMRQVIISRARARLAAKRGGGDVPIPLDEERVGSDEQAEWLLDRDRTLALLRERDERRARGYAPSSPATTIFSRLFVPIESGSGTISSPSVFERASDNDSSRLTSPIADNNLKGSASPAQFLKEKRSWCRLSSAGHARPRTARYAGSSMDADRDALARFLDGDERAFEELVIRYEAKLRHLAFGVLRDRALAEDVAQETFLTAYRKAGSFRAEGSVRGWLFRIAVRRALDELKKRVRKAEVALPDDGRQVDEPHKQLDAGWDLERALERLTPEHRAALILKEVEGLSYQEIAETLGWPMGTVATRIHRARLELRASLQEKSNVVS